MYLLAAAGLLALAMFLGTRPGQGLPTPQDPARTALVDARLHVSLSFGHERELLSDADAAHQELEMALRLLAQARSDDPAIRTQIDALRARLANLWKHTRAEREAPDALSKDYRTLSNRIQALIRES